ncbi:UNVERIFIED_CONTAM: putative protein ycf72 [Sesamum latifolium]
MEFLLFVVANIMFSKYLRDYAVGERDGGTPPPTTGRLPSQRLDPALPKLFWFAPTFPTCPTVAEQFLDDIVE